jgi:hypothetical protein
MVDLGIDGESLTTTPEHPFFTQERGWVAAGDLELGEHVRTADGTFGEVETINVRNETRAMYNLTVATAHTFFVGEGQWLVHNDCLEAIQQQVADAMQPHLDAIKSIAPDAEVGFRGSLARGRKGPHKGNAPFDPSAFDVDAFIVSDELAAKYPRNTWFRAGDQIPELQSAQSQIGSILQEQLPGLKDEPFTFRVFTSDEFARKVGEDERFFIK